MKMEATRKALSLSELEAWHWDSISHGHIPAQVRILGITCHFFMCTFHFIYTLGGLHAFGSPSAYNLFLSNLRIANHILIN